MNIIDTRWDFLPGKHESFTLSLMTCIQSCYRSNTNISVAILFN